MNLLIWATPVYFILIAIEAGYDHWRSRGLYSAVDAATSIATGVMRSLIIVPFRAVLFIAYVWVQAIVNIEVVAPENVRWFHWLVCFIACDFCFYWFHRTAHRNNFLWGVHHAHHSSEYYNLSTALRKGILQPAFDWPFFLPVALMGLPLDVFVWCFNASFLYQFWLHSQFVPKLPWIEWLLVTPSIHRVHHGRNNQYIDKNHAGVFSVWDRMFGTFEEENEQVDYGVTTPLPTWSPWSAQTDWWLLLWKDWQSADWRERIQILAGPTGYRPQSSMYRRPSFKPGNKHIVSRKFSIAAIWFIVAVTCSALVLATRKYTLLAYCAVPIAFYTFHRAGQAWTGQVDKSSAT